MTLSTIIQGACSCAEQVGVAKGAVVDTNKFGGACVALSTTIANFAATVPALSRDPQ